MIRSYAIKKDYHTQPILSANLGKLLSPVVQAQQESLSWSKGVALGLLIAVCCQCASLTFSFPPLRWADTDCETHPPIAVLPVRSYVLKSNQFLPNRFHPQYSPAVKSVSASWAVLRNSSRSRSWVTDFNLDVESTSVVYWGEKSDGASCNMRWINTPFQTPVSSVHPWPFYL